VKRCRATLAALPSLLVDPQANLRRVAEAVRTAAEEGSRLILLPELMLTGHGGHPRMVENAEPVPEGPLAREVLDLSLRYEICICVGMAELRGGVAYNSQIVMDRGRYLGAQRKIHLSGDEYCYFAPGQEVPIFDIGDVRFGVTVCYDSFFPELSLLHHVGGAEAVLSAHAARSGEWPAEPDRAFCTAKIAQRQGEWVRRYAGRAEEYNCYVLLCNAVGPSTAGLDGVTANHAGTVMAIDPRGEVMLETDRTDFSAEIRTLELDPERLGRSHAPTRNRRLRLFRDLLGAALRDAAARDAAAGGTG